MAEIKHWIAINSFTSGLVSFYSPQNIGFRDSGYVNL